MSLPPPTLAYGTLSRRPPCTETVQPDTSGAEVRVHTARKFALENAPTTADLARLIDERSGTPWKPSLPRENQRVSEGKRKRL